MLTCKKPEYRPWVSWAGQDRLYRAQQAHLLPGTPSESSLLTALCCCIWCLCFSQHCQVSPAPWLCAGCQLEQYLLVFVILELQREKSMDMHLQVRPSVCFLFSMPPMPLASLLCHRPSFSPHCCRCPVFPLLQPVALEAPPAPLASPAVLLCISPTVSSLSILSFLFSQPAV